MPVEFLEAPRWVAVESLHESLALAAGRRILSSLGHCETATRLVFLTRMAHPDMVVAGGCMKLKVSVCFDSTRPHSQRHGEKLLDDVLGKLTKAEARKALVAEVVSTSKLAAAKELQFVLATAKACWVALSSSCVYCCCDPL